MFKSKCYSRRVYHPKLLEITVNILSPLLSLIQLIILYFSGCWYCLEKFHSYSWCKLDQPLQVIVKLLKMLNKSLWTKGTVSFQNFAYYLSRPASFLLDGPNSLSCGGEGGGRGDVSFFSLKLLLEFFNDEVF